MRTDQRPQFPNPRSAAEVPQTAHVFAVALTNGALAQLPRHVLPPGARVTLTPLARLTAQALTGPDAPDLVLAPLTAQGFDAMDLLAALARARYRGRVLVLTPPMPDLPLVRADVAAQTPGLNVDVIALDGSSPLHLL